MAIFLKNFPMADPGWIRLSENGIHWLILNKIMVNILSVIVEHLQLVFFLKEIKLPKSKFRVSKMTVKIDVVSFIFNIYAYIKLMFHHLKLFGVTHEHAFYDNQKCSQNRFRYQQLRITRKMSLVPTFICFVCRQSIGE